MKAKPVSDHRSPAFRRSSSCFVRCACNSVTQTVGDERASPLRGRGRTPLLREQRTPPAQAMQRLSRSASRLPLEAGLVGHGE